MCVQSGSTIRRRQLARRLRLLREEAGLTLEVAAPALDWSPSKLSRIENAHQAVDVHSVRSMLDLYGVGGGRWTELIELTRAARGRGWWRAYGLDDQGYVPLEAEASVVRSFASASVPGLLQTAEYARALFRANLHQWSEARLENEATVRMIRQDRLTSDEQPLDLGPPHPALSTSRGLTPTSSGRRSTREGKNTPGSAPNEGLPMVRPEGWIRPAGGSPVPVGTGAPGSRPRFVVETRRAERGVESLFGGSKSAGRSTIRCESCSLVRPIMGEPSRSCHGEGHVRRAPFRGQLVGSLRGMGIGTHARSGSEQERPVCAALSAKTTGISQ